MLANIFSKKTGMFEVIAAILLGGILAVLSHNLEIHSSGTSISVETKSNIVTAVMASEDDVDKFAYNLVIAGKKPKACIIPPKIVNQFLPNINLSEELPLLR